MTFRIENIDPILNVKDMARSVSFYVDVLGFKNADWGSDEFTSVSRDGRGLYLCKGGQGLPGTWVWIGFEGDIVALHEQLKARGITIKLAPSNFPWAYEMQIEDPDGHILRLATEPNPNEPFVQPG